jgi:AmiR/NasT family two-component response regulator
LTSSPARAIADATAISILQQRALQEARLVAEQLRTALDSRILIELAKGVLAERARLTVGDAFVRIRRYAPDHNETIASVSRSNMDRALGVRDLL